MTSTKLASNLCSKPKNNKLIWSFFVGLCVFMRLLICFALSLTHSLNVFPLQTIEANQCDTNTYRRLDEWSKKKSSRTKTEQQQKFSDTKLQTIQQRKMWFRIFRNVIYVSTGSFFSIQLHYFIPLTHWMCVVVAFPPFFLNLLLLSNFHFFSSAYAHTP